MSFLFQKAFGWDGAQSGGSPSGPQGGGVGGQGAQGLVHWMSVMAEHMDPAVSHYMSWNQEVNKNILIYVAMFRTSENVNDTHTHTFP